MNTKDGALDRKFTVPVRTELQVSLWEGPEGISVPSRAARTDGSRTALFAVPKKWTELADCIDDWKAFDETNIDRDVAAAMCSNCPVRGDCLADAMAQEGTQTPHHRAGIRGGLTPVDRFALAVGDKKCERGHAFKQFGKIRADGTAYCAECARLGDKRRYHTALPTDPRHERIPCPKCGASVLKRNKSRHMKTRECQDFVQ